MMALAASEVPAAEARGEENEESERLDWKLICTALVILAFAFFSVKEFLYQVYLIVKTYWKETETKAITKANNATDETFTARHVDRENDDFNENDLTTSLAEAFRDRTGIETPSLSDRRATAFLDSTVNSTEDSKFHASSREWSRWSNLIAEVNQEDDSSEWAQLRREINSGACIDCFTKHFVIHEGTVTKRWRSFAKHVGKTDTFRFSDEQVRNWIRGRNEFLVSVAKIIKQQTDSKKEIESKQGVDRTVLMIKRDLLRDKSSQTPATYDRTQQPPKMIQLSEREHGAWDAVSVFDDRNL